MLTDTTGSPNSTDDAIVIGDIFAALSGWRGDPKLRALLRSIIQPNTLTVVAGLSGAGKSRLLLQYLTDPPHTVYLSPTQNSEELARVSESVGAQLPYLYGSDQLPVGPVRQLIQWVLSMHPESVRIVVDPAPFFDGDSDELIAGVRDLCRSHSVVLATMLSAGEGDIQIDIEHAGSDWIAPDRLLTVTYGGQTDTFNLQLDSDGRLVPGGHK